jgi:hypothetical protein
MRYDRSAGRAGALTFALHLAPWLQVTHTVADAVRSLTHLGSLLTGAPSASAADGTAGAAQGGREHTVSSWGVQGPAAGGGGQGVGSSRMGAMRQAAADAEKEQLRDEVGGLSMMGLHRAMVLRCVPVTRAPPRCMVPTNMAGQLCWCSSVDKEPLVLWLSLHISVAMRYVPWLAVPPVHRQVARLRSQLRAVVDKAAGAAGAASIELQVSQCLSG